MEQKIINYGNVFNPNFNGGSYAGYVYDPKGLAPCLNTMSGGLRMPLVIVEVNDEHKQNN